MALGCHLLLQLVIWIHKHVLMVTDTWDQVQKLVMQLTSSKNLSLGWALKYLKCLMVKQPWRYKQEPLSTTPFCGNFVTVHLGWRQWEMSRVGLRSPVDQRCEQRPGEDLLLSSGAYQTGKAMLPRRRRDEEVSLASKLSPHSHRVPLRRWIAESSEFGASWTRKPTFFMGGL